MPICLVCKFSWEQGNSEAPWYISNESNSFELVVQAEEASGPPTGEGIVAGKMGAPSPLLYNTPPVPTKVDVIGGSQDGDNGPPRPCLIAEVDLHSKGRVAYDPTFWPTECVGCTLKCV